MSSVDATLAERGTNYGDFKEDARVCQSIKKAMRDSPNWEKLDPDMVQALELIAVKIARILNGNPSYKDSWHDIIGYARLVETRLT